MSDSPHKSDHAIGTTFTLDWHRTARQHYIARLMRKEFHGEMWNVYAVHADGRESYLMSEGWRWVNEQKETV